MLTHEWHGGGNVFIRPNILTQAGDHIEGHTHTFDHVTIVFTGACRVEATGPDGQRIVREFTAPSHFLVKADWAHRIEALVDTTHVWCVYAHRTPQADVVEEYTGWPDAYV